jgi:hypothetical protein
VLKPTISTLGTSAENLRCHLDAVGERKARLLGRAFGNRQDQLVEQAGGPADEVFVTTGDRVEGAGIDRYAMIRVCSIWPPQQVKMDFPRLALAHRAPIAKRCDFVFGLDVNRCIFVQYRWQQPLQAAYPARLVGRIEEDQVEFRFGRNQIL